jgi:Undecaprenyl-phosphate glucose phosphotransferase
VVIVVAIPGFARSGAYDPLRTTPLTKTLIVAAGRMFEALLVAAGCLFIFGISDSFSRFWLVAWGSSSVVALTAFRLLARCATGRLMRSGRLTRSLAVVGTGEMAERFAAQLVQNSGVGTRLVGVFDQQPLPADDTPCPRDLVALDTLLAEGKVDEIVVALPAAKTARIAQLIRRFQPFAVAIRMVVPQEFEYFCERGNFSHGDINTLLVFRKPLDEAGSVVKWLEDKVLAALCLFAVLPLMLCIALAIKLDSRGPALFRQKRLGVNNRPFNLLKFRSMYADQADPLGRESTRPGDRRVTRVGRVLRSTSLDELPQLINVLRGEMSLVGPRPHALGSKAGGVLFDDAVDDYRLRHRVKPGITGWAQVNGWRGETTRIEQLKERVKCDLYYVNNWSLMFDFVILGRTFFTVLSRRNAV